MAFKLGNKGKQVDKTVSSDTNMPESSAAVTSENSTHPLDAKKHTVLSRRKLAFRVIAIVLLAAGLTAFLLVRKDIFKDNSSKIVCSRAVLEKSVPLIDPLNIDTVKLKPIVSEIEKTSGYEKDANCLYITLTLYINTGDPVMAKKVWGQLEEAYDSKKGYDQVIKNIALTPDRLKTLVDEVQNRKNGYSQNARVPQEVIDAYNQ